MGRTTKLSAEYRYQLNRVNSMRTYYNRVNKDKPQIEFSEIKVFSEKELREIRSIDDLLIKLAG